MPLPIPNIIENASNVLKAAKAVSSFLEGDGQMTPNNDLFLALKEALKKVSPADLLAVLNEVGKVYVGIHNLQVQQIGARGNKKDNTFDVAFVTDFGLGPRTIVTPLAVAVAEELVKNMNIELSLMKPGGLITDAGAVNG